MIKYDKLKRTKTYNLQRIKKLKRNMTMHVYLCHQFFKQNSIRELESTLYNLFGIIYWE